MSNQPNAPIWLVFYCVRVGARSSDRTTIVRVSTVQRNIDDKPPAEFLEKSRHEVVAEPERSALDELEEIEGEQRDDASSEEYIDPSRGEWFLCSSKEPRRHRLPGMRWPIHAKSFFALLAFHLECQRLGSQYYSVILRRTRIWNHHETYTAIYKAFERMFGEPNAWKRSIHPFSVDSKRRITIGAEERGRISIWPKEELSSIRQWTFPGDKEALLQNDDGKREESNVDPASRRNRIVTLDAIVEELAQCVGEVPDPAYFLWKLQEAWRNSHDVDVWRRAIVLEGYLWVRLGFPPDFDFTCGNEIFESPVLRLQQVADEYSPWAAAACWILGKLETQRSTRTPDAGGRGARARVWYEKITCDIELKCPILLPELRGELSVASDARRSQQLDPPTQVVCVPYRFRGAATLAEAAAVKDPAKRKKLLHSVASDIQNFEHKRGTSDEQLKLNLEFLKAVTATLQWVLSGRKEGAPGAHEDILDAVRSLKTVRASKAAEWQANCYAGIACTRSRGSAEARATLELLCQRAEVCLQANGGRTAAFRTDAIYELAIQQDISGEFRNRFDALLLRYEVKLMRSRRMHDPLAPKYRIASRTLDERSETP